MDMEINFKKPTYPNTSDMQHQLLVAGWKLCGNLYIDPENTRTALSLRAAYIEYKLRRGDWVRDNNQSVKTT